jgi:putative transposase
MREPYFPFWEWISRKCSLVTDESHSSRLLLLFWQLAAEGGRPTPQSSKMSANSAILAKYRYRRRLPHLQKADADLFVTFCTSARRILPEKARDIVFEHCLREAGVARASSPAKASPGNLLPRIHLHAVVVMPDHVHILLRPLRDENGWPFPLVNILQCFKGATAHRINKLLGSSGPVWEEESFDHVLRSDESLKEKCEYIRQNPVRAGLVRKPEDYRWLWIDPEFRE